MVVFANRMARSFPSLTIATRPCLSSDSRYFLKRSGSVGQSPKGSKKPKGLDTPGSFMGLKTEDGEDDEAWTVVLLWVPLFTVH